MLRDGGGWSNLQWKQDASHREVKVMRKYHIQDREDYHKYVHSFSAVQELMEGTTSYVDPWDHLYTNYHFYRLKTHFELRRNRKCSTSYMIWASWVRSPLPCIGLSWHIDLNAKPSDIENKLTVSSVARRRLAVVVTKLRMAETVSDVRLLYPSTLGLTNRRFER
jgi:U3 small nucleolar ribonucleoprotein protein IMP3